MLLDGALPAGGQDVGQDLGHTAPPRAGVGGSARRDGSAALRRVERTEWTGIINVAPQLPEWLLAEERAVEAQIRRAFHGVSREGGVSWGEAFVIDGLTSEEEEQAARAEDVDQAWEELVDDPRWIHEPCIGGMSFLDAIGFRYYVAPVMIRCIRERGGEFVESQFNWGEMMPRRVALLSIAQRRAIARFVRLMIAVSSARGQTQFAGTWIAAYKNFWRVWDAGSRRG